MINRKRRTVSFPLLFYSLNAVLLVLGIHLWIAYQIFRVLIPYSIFNIILFSLADAERKETVSSRVSVAFPAILRYIVASAIIGLLVSSVIITLQGLYVRPFCISVTVCLALILLVVLLLGNSKSSKLPSKWQPFLMVAILFILFYIFFSIYLVQPNLGDKPVYATVDAYRDYTNAHRLLELAKIEPEKMVLERYYRTFPVVPLQLASVSLITGLPLAVTHLAIAVIYVSLTGVCLVLLSKAIISNKGCFQPICFLSTLLLLFFPTLVDPMFTLTPIMFSIPLVALAIYLAYKKLRHAISQPSISLLIILLSLVIVPLHAASSLAVIVLFALLALFNRGTCSISGSFRRLVVILAALFITYLTIPAISPFTSVYQVARSFYSVLEEVFAFRFPVIVEKAFAGVGLTQVSEVDRFLQAINFAFLPSVFTIFTVVTLRKRCDDQFQNSHALHVCYGVLLVLAFGGGYLISLWGIDLRYFIFPLIPIATVPIMVVISRSLKGANFARVLTLFVVLTLVVVSFSFSPFFLHETSSGYARLIPTERERTAGAFVADFFDYEKLQPAQVVADWPFYAYVRALLYSRHFGLESSVKIPILMYEPLDARKESIIFSRRYFNESTFLKNVSPYVKPLCNIDQHPIFSKVLDIGSVSVYLGSLK